MTSKVVDLAGVIAPEDKLQQEIRDAQNAKTAKAGGSGDGVGGRRPDARRVARHAGRERDRGVTRAYTYNELIGKQGGLTALHFAARQGAMRDGEGARRTPAPTSTR